MTTDRPGTYALILYLPHSVADICVGRLGRFYFPAGWYAYVGSARGPGGLAARLARHLRQVKPLHWHIDYLRAHASPVEIWYVTGTQRRECVWARSLLGLSDASVPVPRFGASDCRCFTHLIHFALPPDLAVFAGALGGPVSREIVSDVLQVFLDAVAAGDDARAEEAAVALGRPGDAVLPLLRDLLIDADADRRWWAARGLAAVGTPAARELLVVALEDADAGVRACAAQGLGELSAAEAASALARHLDDPSLLVSRIVSDSLARIGRSAVPVLIAALREGTTLARVGAARALGAIGPPEAISALYAALDDPSAVVTHYAEEALEGMGVGLALFQP